MAEKHFNPGPATPEGRTADSNVIPFRRPLEPLPRPPAISICDVPLFVCGNVMVEALMSGLGHAGLCLRQDPQSGRFLIDYKPIPG